MSSRERRRQAKRSRTLCTACRARKARFRHRGEVRADRDHTLCFKCYRSELNRARAQRMTAPTVSTHGSPFGVRGVGGVGTLDARQLAHRQRMLEHLQAQRAVAS